MNYDEIKKWQPIHFTIYLYICIGKSDYNLADEEIETIFEKLNNSEIPNLNINNIYKDVLKFHSKQTDSDVVSLIKEQSNIFCKNLSNLNQVLQDLEDIMEADGVVRDVEMIMYRFIKRTLSDN